MTTDLHGTVQRRLADEGQRYTAQRRELVELLAGAGSPLDLPQILEERRDLKQSSVYRNLAALEQAGVVSRVTTEADHGRYELAQELTGHHHHLACANCGTMRDLLVPPKVEATLDRAIDRLARDAGFASVSHRLDLIGLCADCAARA
jgi:Fur family ferric uptake transcriptional regulator